MCIRDRGKAVGGDGVDGSESDGASTKKDSADSSDAAGSAGLNEGDEAEARAKWVREVLPGADGFDDGAAAEEEVRGRQASGRIGRRSSVLVLLALALLPAL